MTKLTKAQIEEMEKAKEELRALLKLGSEVLTQVKHVSRSGMMRVITTRFIKDGQLLDLDYSISKATGYKLHNKYDGIKIEGCGMDMGFALIYDLSRTLYPKGFECIGEGCPSNDHANGDRDYTPHHHESGGYAIRQRWL
jgi:hypothetical protein